MELDPPTSFDQMPYWQWRYDQDLLQWHSQEPHPKLVKFLPTMTDGLTNKKFFIPLCGKTQDIPYLLSLGHEVFAIEAVLKAIKDLEQENGYAFHFDETTSIFSTEDGKLKIFHGDYFGCPVEKFGPFDCIWDRGSFGSFKYDRRIDYLEVIKRSVRNKNGGFHNFKYLLQTYNYDKEATFQGPPVPVDDFDMKTLFSYWLVVNEVDRFLAPKVLWFDKPVFPDPTWELTYLMTPLITDL